MKTFLILQALVGILIILFVTPYCYTIGILKMEYGVNLRKSDIVKAFIPGYNVAFAERVYSGKKSRVGISVVIMVLALAARLIAFRYFPEVQVAQIGTLVIFLVSVVLWYVANALSVAVVLTDAGVNSTLGVIAKSVIFPFGQYYIGSMLSTDLKAVENYRGDEDTF